MVFRAAASNSAGLTWPMYDLLDVCDVVHSGAARRTDNKITGQQIGVDRESAHRIGRVRKRHRFGHNPKRHIRRQTRRRLQRRHASAIHAGYGDYHRSRLAYKLALIGYQDDRFDFEPIAVTLSRHSTPRIDYTTFQVSEILGSIHTF